MRCSNRPIYPILVLLFLAGCENGTKDAQLSKSLAAETFNGVLVRPDSTVIILQKPRLLVAMLDSQQMSWSVTLREDIVTTPVVAKDSSLYVLSAQKVYRLGNDGRIQFQIPIALGEVASKKPRRYFLTAMSDSSVVVGNGWGKSIKVSINGEVEWEFTLPEQARLIDPPVSGPNGSLYLRTERWLYSVSHEGRVRWRLQSGPGAFR